MADNPVRRSLARFFGVAVATAAAGNSIGADEPVRRTFDVEPGARVVLDVDFGTVAVRSWEHPRVEVVVERPDALDLEFEQADGAVTILGRKRVSGWSLANWRSRPSFQLNVPYRHSLELRTAGGDIDIDRLEGAVAARTSGGDVRIGEVAGPVDARTSGGSVHIGGGHETVARTSGGNIRIGNANGRVSATTSGGSIETEAVAGDVSAKTSGGTIRIGGAGGAIQARTSGGSISAEFVAQPTAASELRTSGGDLRVYVSEDIAVNLDARTSGGRISTDLPIIVADERSAKTRLETVLNGGGPDLSLRASGGSIRLQRLVQ